MRPVYRSGAKVSARESALGSTSSHSRIAAVATGTIVNHVWK